MTTTSPVGAPGEQSRRSSLVVVASLTLAAVLAWAWPLLMTPEALFWDDWVVAGSDTIAWARELGLPWLAYIHGALFTLGPWSFKVLAIVATVTIGWLVYLIGDRGLGLNRGERWLLALLVVALPVYSTRIIAILSTYNWSLALFMLGWWLLVRRDPADPGRARFIAAALLLFASYTTASLLPFTVLPVAHLALLAVPRDVPLWRGALRFAGRFWYLLAAPIVFWVLRSLFLKPFGLYAGYNAIGQGINSVVSLSAVALIGALLIATGAFLYWLLARRPGPARRDALATALLSATVGSLSAFLYVTRVSTGWSARVVPLALAVAAVALLASAVVRLVRGGEQRASVTPVLAVGVGALVIALVPYLLVGKIPSFAGWETRHQLLMPFGIATIAVATVRAWRPLVPRALVRVVSVLVVAGMVAVSAVISLTLVADWKKQAQLIALLKDEPAVRAAGTVVFHDLAPQLNYDGRIYDFYEYNGWMLNAYGDEKRFGMDISALPGFLAGANEPIYTVGSRYRFTQWTPTDRGVLVTIEPVEGATWWSLLLDQPSVTISVSADGDLADLPIPVP